MARLIDADAFKDYIMDGIADHEDIPLSQFSIVEAAAKGFLLDIDEQPTISPDEVRGVGEWEIDEQEVGGIFGGRQIVKIPCCSNCGTHNEWKTNYCPNCGAKMKGADDGTTD